MCTAPSTEGGVGSVRSATFTSPSSYSWTHLSKNGRCHARTAVGQIFARARKRRTLHGCTAALHLNFAPLLASSRSLRPHCHVTSRQPHGLRVNSRQSRNSRSTFAPFARQVYAGGRAGGRGSSSSTNNTPSVRRSSSSFDVAQKRLN